MDVKYNLNFIKEQLEIKYGFICFDWSNGKDFTKYTKNGAVRKTIKQAEVQLVQDDYYLGGGLSVFNNNKNLDGVLNFGELMGKITNFLNSSYDESGQTKMRYF